MSFLKDTANVKKCKMKKEYFRPEAIAIEFGTVNMLAASAARFEYRNLGQDSPEGSESMGQWGDLWNN